MIQNNQKIIEETITLPENSEDVEIEFQTFKDNLNFIIENRELIYSNLEFYYSSFKKAHVSLMFLGDYHAGIGHLLHLWMKNILIDNCDYCNGKLYIFSAEGSPLSGRNQCEGICDNCKNVIKKRLQSSKPIVKALKYIKSNPNKRKILRTKGQYFTWKYGLAGAPVPDEVIKEGIQPVSVQELVTGIKQFNET